jgi:hypothetical protein
MVRRAISLSPVSGSNSRRSPLLAALAAAALLLGAGAHNAIAQITYTGGGAISISGSAASGHSSLTASGASGSVKTVSVTLNGVTTNGTANLSVFYSSFVLQGPGGQKFVLLGSTGDSNDNGGLSNATITIDDAASNTAPLAVPWSSSGGTVKPSSYWLNINAAGFTTQPSDINGDSLPQSDGSATLNGTFNNTAPNGAWTLYIFTDDPNTGDTDPISIASWTLTLTFNATASDSTATTVSSNTTNPASTTGSITYTATVTDTTNGGTTVGTGSVAFSANGITIAGCGAQPVSGGQATCSTTLSAQGLYAIEASYAAGTGFESSTSSNIEQLVERSSTEPAPNTWCNSGAITVPGQSPGVAYPSVIKVTGYGAQTVANVEVELMDVTGIVTAQHLLVAPNGGAHNLDFFDYGFNPADNASSGIELNFFDSAGAYPDSNNAPASGSFEASDTLPAGPIETFPASSAPTYDSSIPQVPGTINYGYDTFSPGARGAITETFESNFNGVPADGTWALYPYETDATVETIGGGWCIALTLNTGVATTTTITTSKGDQTTGIPVTLTATVTSGGSPVTSGGTVTFLENGTAPPGTTGGNNVVALNGSGQATFTTSALPEGDNEIVAEYSGDATDNPSQASFFQRIDDATGVLVGGGNFRYCNTGRIVLNAASGPYAPNPSNIYVTNLPGTISSMSLTLDNFSTASDSIYGHESLVEGPTTAALDFFSSVGSSATVLSSGNYTFEDSAGSEVPQSNFSPGIYQPTSYANIDSIADRFYSSSSPSSTSPFYPAPATFAYAAPRGSATFGNTFGGTNPNGTWSLFFDQLLTADETDATGWCLNFTQNPVTVTVGLNHNGSGTGGEFVAGQTAAQIITTVTNNGAGSTGDPLGSNPLTLTDTLSSALTYTGFTGTGWSCSAAGQTVTCTNDSAVAQSSAYPTLTFNVNVSSSAPSTIGNSVSVSGAGITSNTGNDTIAVEATPVLAVSKAHTGTFTAGSTGVWALTISNASTSGSTSGTVTVSDALPIGFTLASYTSTSSLWTCGGTANVVFCTATPGIAGGGNSVIALTVNIPATSPTSVSNTALAWGGGDVVHTSPGTAAVSNTDTVTVNQGPAITSAASTTFNTGTAGSFTVTTTGSPTATLSKTGSLPTGVMFFDNGNGTATFLGTPAAGTGGTYSITITASNGVGTNATQTFTLTVDQAPAITSTASTTFTAGATGSFTVTGSGYPAPTFTESGSLPSGVTFLSSGTLSGLPSAGTGGIFTITITASNGVGTNATQTFTLTVDQPPIVTSANNAAFMVGIPGSFTVTTVAFPAAALSLSGTLPSGITFTDTGNGTGTLQGKAAAGTVGSYPVTITAMNGTGVNGQQSFTLTIDPVPNFVVTNTNDSGSGSLRTALSNAATAGSGNITFLPSAFSTAQTITLTSGTLNIPPYTSITGPTSGSGATLTNLLTVNGNNASTVFTVGPGVTGASISGLIVTGGSSSSHGGGIYNQGALTVSSSTVFGNAASGGFGGGIANTGTLTLTDSLVYFNSAAGGQGGGIFNSGTLTVTNSTIAGNSALTGGGVFNVVGSIALTNDTINANAATGGGGIYNSPGDTAVLANSIVTVNIADADIDGSYADNGGNFVAVGILASLGEYGGPTRTALPLPGSPAICGGLAANIPAGVTTDQRGFPRTNITYPGYSSSTPCVDAGAAQTNYALSFTTEPSPISPATQIVPNTNFQAAVTLDESGSAFAGPGNSISLTLTGNGTLSGGTSSFSSGAANDFSTLQVSAAGLNDELTANLTLNGAATPAVAISATSSQFNVGQITPSLSFAPSPASESYGTAIAAGSLDATASYNSANVAGTFAYTTTVNGNPVTLVAGATVLPAGNYTITATFTPSNTTVYEATSITASYTVNAAPLTITASNGSMTYGGTPPAIAPGYSGFVNGDSASSLTTQPSCSTAATSRSAVGSYPSTCTGAIDANYSIGYTPGSVTVAQAASITTVGLSSAAITPGQNETITATVVSSTTGTPTGSVNFFDGTTLLGTVPITSGTATYTTASLAPGVTHSISAVYSGDANFTGSTSSTTASVTVAPLDFTMTITGPSSATAIPGQSISYQVMVNPLYGSYAGTVNFAVTGLPPGASVTFSPSSIAANGGPQTITVTITAAAANAASHAPLSPTRRAAPLALALLLMCGLGAVRRRGRAMRRLLSIVVLLAGGAAATLATGCGGGFFAQAPQSYNVTITATAGGIEHTASVSLNVQ